MSWLDWRRGSATEVPTSYPRLSESGLAVGPHPVSKRRSPTLVLIIILFSSSFSAEEASSTVYGTITIGVYLETHFVLQLSIKSGLSVAVGFSEHSSLMVPSTTRYTTKMRVVQDTHLWCVKFGAVG
ncbi:hypothetical protein K449DRAFT_383837 [Hypoxylon sp. EC38]|nr:hypothetical protein K449DRAFT_383837 [Hypoxylon sp. EC38]